MAPGARSTSVRVTVLSAFTTYTKVWLPSAKIASSGTTSASARSASVTETSADMPGRSL